MGREESLHSSRHDSSDVPGLELEYPEVDEHLFEKRRETKFLLKLDVCLMTWAWLAYLIKVGLHMLGPYPIADIQANRLVELQDRICVRDEGGCESTVWDPETWLTWQMGFQGNQLNYLDTLFRIGYAIFLIVSSSLPSLCLIAS